MSDVLSTDIIDRFTAIVGDRYALRTDAEIAPFIEDARGRYQTASPLVLRPGSTDEVSAMREIDVKTKLVESGHPNLKITTPADLALAEALLRQAPSS